MRSLVAIGSALVVLAAFACSDSDGAAGAADGGSDAAPAVCELAKIVRYETAECDSCMQERCCDKTAACFSKAQDPDGDCAALHACLVRCPETVGQFFIPITGVGTADASVTENPDAGSECRTACQAKHPASVDKQAVYDTCIREQCKVSCTAEE